MTERLTIEGSSVGTLLNERYELRGLLGRGGMGEVYEGLDRQLARIVAVKIMRPDLAADGRFLTRFRREARTAARLSHPGIVSVHDFGLDGRRCYIVMEFVPGRTLGAIVREDGPIDPRRAASLISDAALALAHAHEHGVIHRDIAPGNVMATPAGGVKVLDFGIARAARGSPRPGPPSARGTLAYVAPEQARGEAADQRVDVYALGAVLYELLSGRPPFADGEGADLLRRISTEVPSSLRDLRPEVPPALEAVVMTCLAKDPRDRFDRADRLASELRKAASTPADPGRPDASTARTLPLPRTPSAAHLTERLPAVPAASGRRSHRRWGRLAVVAATVATLLGAASIGLSAVLGAAGPHPPASRPERVPVPTGLTVETSCNGWFATKAVVAWTPGGPSGGYEVWRLGPGQERYSLLARIDDRRTTSYTDQGLGLDAPYRYVVRAVDGTRRSAATPEVLAQTPLWCLG
jgi:serine/threonine-protein kinase